MNPYNREVPNNKVVTVKLDIKPEVGISPEKRRKNLHNWMCSNLVAQKIRSTKVFIACIPRMYDTQ